MARRCLDTFQVTGAPTIGHRWSTYANVAKHVGLVIVTGRRCGRLQAIVWQGADVADPVGLGARTARGPAVRWPALALAGLMGAVLVGSWLPGQASRQGVEAVDDRACPARVGAVMYPDRPGRDRLLLPVAYQDAPTATTWCRFAPDGSLVDAARLDATRTARLVASLVAPPGGWPDDALAAKEIVPLTDARLEEMAAAACGAPSEADLLVFRYEEGPDAAVLIRGEPCSDAANGVVTVRTPPGVAADLADLRGVLP